MAAPDPARKVASFGLFEADLHTGELRKRGVKIKLRDKSFELLAALLEHPGDVVTREELQNRLWPSGVFVDFDNNLNTAITRLREALGDSADKPRFVETLPRRGYRFVAPVSVRQVGGYERPRGRVKLAVLPFENLSGDPGQEYFSDGMTEELITGLARVAPERLGVIARTSAMRYKRSRKDLIRIGRELDVDYILEGSVRRAGDHVRISAQLIQVDLQTHLWAQSYDGDLRDALNLQRDIARAITNQMGLKLPSQVVQSAEGERAIIAEAYDAYLLGVHQLSQGTPSGFAKAEEYFRLATEKDPQFAPAYARSATGHAMAGYFGYVSYSDAYPKAEAAARRALELDASLAEPHGALALVEWFYRWNVPACEREYQKALELNPNDPTAHFGMAMFQASMRQDHERAAVEAHLALSLDPLSILVRSMLCWTSYWSRSYDQAIDQARKTLELEVDAPQACYVLGAAARAKGALTDAITVLENAAARFADPLSVAYLGMAYALAGRRDEAQASLQRLKEGYGPHGVPSIFFAFVYTGLADHQMALDHLDRAFDEHDAFVLWLPVSPDWDLLRGETRFKQLLDRLRSAVQLEAPA